MSRRCGRRDTHSRFDRMDMGYYPLVLLLFCAQAVSAQDFEVVESLPVTAQTSVPLETTVHLTFNSPIDTTARFDGEGPLAFFSIEPADAITINDVHFNEELTEAIFSVTHRDSTDYVWILTGARSAVGSLLCRPHVLSYTTRKKSGRGLVRGHVEIIIAVKRSSCSPRAVAALLDSSPDSSASVLAAVAVDNGGAFEINGVKAGTYWPVLLVDWDRNGLFRPIWNRIGDVESEVGAHDPDWDGIPDSIDIADSTSIEILLGAYGSSSSESPELPGAVTFLQTYPNPSRGDIRVAFELERPAPIAITVFDLLGRPVTEVFGGLVSSGVHERSWDMDGLPAGLYVVRIDGPSFALVRPIILLR